MKNNLVWCVLRNVTSPVCCRKERLGIKRRIITLVIH